MRFKKAYFILEKAVAHDWIFIPRLANSCVATQHDPKILLLPPFISEKLTNRGATGGENIRYPDNYCVIHKIIGSYSAPIVIPSAARNL